MSLNLGGTSFGNALLRFIDIIQHYMNENTCIVMITDGQAPYPSSEIIMVMEILKKVRENGCKTCAICFFIESQFMNSAPSSFKKMC